MSKEYAVISPQNEILFRTPGFDLSDASPVSEFEGGARLFVCGGAALEQENLEKLNEAKGANEAKELFFSNMSHDIRTPMNAIVGMTALAKKHIDEKNRVYDALGKIEIASGHLLSLINDVLDMSRINSGKLNLKNERFSLGDLLHETLTIIRPMTEKKGQTLRFELGNVVFESLYGDPLRLRQIYVNIINNSVKYTKEGGEIDVCVFEETEGAVCRLVFVCRDNGIGMTEEFLKRVFEPFERVNSSTISGIEGTGLGMSIVKSLVGAMRGKIDVESKLGAGTTVTISIPAEYENLRADTSFLKNKRFLIIEADEESRGRFAQYLNEFSIGCTTVDSASEAIARMTDAQFDGEKYDGLVIGRKRSDDMDAFGRRLAQALEEIGIASYFKKSYPGITVILSGDEKWEEIEYRAVKSGIDAFIPMPFFRMSLINGLNAALRDSDPTEAHASLPDLRGKRILLAEDNAINMEIAKEILSETGVSVDAAENGKIAVEAYTASEIGHYDLILMDIQMPVMDGYAAARAIRASGRSDSDLPVFAMTANTFAEDIIKAKEAGMDGHIPKPIDVNLLMHKLRIIE